MAGQYSYILIGTTLACFQELRRKGIYLMALSTGGTLLSLLLSTAVLFLAPRMGFEHLGTWSGVALIGTYVLAIVAGAFIGSASAFLLALKLLPRRQRKQTSSETSSAHRCGRPMEIYSNPASRIVSGSSRFLPSTINGSSISSCSRAQSRSLYSAQSVRTSKACAFAAAA